LKWKNGRYGEIAMPVQDPIDVCRNTRKAKGRGMVEIPA
jgi:hypothetical protein